LPSTHNTACPCCPCLALLQLKEILQLPVLVVLDEAYIEFSEVPSKVRSGVCCRWGCGPCRPARITVLPHVVYLAVLIEVL
jgi:hypothetical protein